MCDSLLSVTTSADAGITVDDAEVIPPLVKVWVSGGTSGNSYSIAILTTTAQGRVKETDLIIRVADR